MEFEVVTVKRSLDLSENYTATKVGTLEIGLQSINDDIVELEIHGPDGIEKISIPMGTAATCQGYTIINRDVGLQLPQGKKRRFLRRDIPAKEGVMEAVLDTRWGDQSMKVEEPEKNAAYDFMLVRQYEIVGDRPKVYIGQDVLHFGELRIEIGDRVEEGSRNFKKPRYAEFVIRHEDEDEPETHQIKLDGKYYRVEDNYRIRVTSYDFYNEWYQAFGISIVKGRPKDYIDETEDVGTAEGIASEAHVGHTEALTLSETRLKEAERNPNEGIIKLGEAKNIGKVGVKVLKMKPGAVQVMLLSPQVKKTVLVHGQPFEFGRYDVTLVGVHGDRAIIRIDED